jgi:hypothetical protein
MKTDSQILRPTYSAHHTAVMRKISRLRKFFGQLNSKRILQYATTGEWMCATSQRAQ